MSLTPPPKVQKLQAALHAKAKGSPGYRFYLLYDKLYRADVLAFAYRCCAANGGAAGVDGQTFEVIEAYGEQRWLDELAEELKQRMYRPQPVRRVYIPKPDGKQRPLGIPTVKTRRCRAWEESFDFLGYTIGKCYSPKTGRAYLGTRPSRKKIARLCQAIHAMTGRDMVWTDAEDRITRLNRLLTGWANYFCLGPVSKAYRLVDKYACHRLRQWLRAKHKLQGEEKSRFSDRVLEQRLGLVRLQAKTRTFPWATA